MTFAQVHQSIIEDGFTVGPPRYHRDPAEIDKEIYEQEPCEQCGGPVEYQQYHKEDRRERRCLGYRAAVRCRACGAGAEV